MQPERESRRSSPAERALEALHSGDEIGLAWLRQRVHSRAARRFAPWAWELIHEDFVADLQLALSQRMRQGVLEFRSGAEAYVDVCIANLCRHYFRTLARLRAQDPVEAESVQLQVARSSALDRIAAALDLHAVLAEMPAPCVRRLRGKYLDGLSMAELAASEGVHEKTMRSRLHECRRRFREIELRLQRTAQRGLFPGRTEES